MSEKNLKLFLGLGLIVCLAAGMFIAHGDNGPKKSERRIMSTG